MLRVVVLGRPELSTELAVRPDGKISLPLVTEIDAVGITPTQLSHNLEERLQTYVLSPKVTVVVQQARSALNQVMVIGQVGKAGALPYRSGMTVLNAVLESNGLSQFAAGNRAVIIRTTNGTQNRIKIRLQDLMNRGDLQQNVLLRSGDVIVVPEARF
jgi:polysaccharide biosynthesis/export protein